MVEDKIQGRGLFAQREKIRLLEFIKGTISDLKAKNQTASYKKMAAIMALDYGVSPTKFKEYIQTFIDAELIILDEDFIIPK